MKNAKKCISILLIMLMVFGCVPVFSSASAATAGITMESDWKMDANNRIKIDIYFEDSVGLTSADAELIYDSDVFCIARESDIKDSNNVSLINSTDLGSVFEPLTSNFNGTEVGIIHFGMCFMEELWSTETWESYGLSINADHFHMWSVYLTVQDPDSYAKTETEISISGSFRIGTAHKTSAYTLTKAAEENQYRPGDLDWDGNITAGDARCALRAAVGMETLTSSLILCADVNQDGIVTAEDARQILRAAFGLAQIGNDNTPSAKPADSDPVVVLDSDWTVIDNNSVVLNVYFDDSVGLQSWQLDFAYDKDVFDIWDVGCGTDAEEVFDLSDMQCLSNIGEDGVIKNAGSFVQYLYSTEQYTNKGIDINSEHFNILTIFLTVEDAEAFAANEQTVSVEGYFDFGTAGQVTVSDSITKPAAEPDWVIRDGYIIIKDESYAVSLLKRFHENSIIVDRTGTVKTDDAVVATGDTLIMPDATKLTVILLGDLDGDGSVSSADERLVMDFFNEKTELTENALIAADVNADHAVTPADARLILRLIVSFSYFDEDIESAKPAGSDPAIVLDSDWIVTDNNTVAMNIYFDDSVGLQTWALDFKYNKDVLGVAEQDDVADGKDIEALYFSSVNPYDLDSNCSEDGIVKHCGLFAQYLFSTEEWKKNRIVVNGEHFNVLTIYLTVEDAEAFAANEQTVSVEGYFDFGTAGQVTVSDSITKAGIVHIWDNGVVTAPTCTEQGYTTYTCSCGDSYVADYVNAKGHTSVVIPAVAPSCTKTGLTEGSKCADCGTTIAAQKTVGKLEHVDSDQDNRCDSCGTKIRDCDCMCHATDFFNRFFYKIIRFFRNLFGIYSECKCGIVHK